MSESTESRTGGFPVKSPGSSPAGMMVAAVDGLALLAFIAVGLRSHRIGAMAEIAARNAVPLAVTWAAVSAVVGTYRRRDVISLVVTWAIAVPVGLSIRTWWVGSPQGGRLAIFLAVGLGSTLLFLLIGRGALGLVARTRPVWRRDP